MWCQTNSGGQTIQTMGAYQSAVSGSFTGTPFTDPAGTAAFDCPIPVLVDRFPSPGPLPILYLRARTGAKGVVWDNITVNYDGNGNQPADYQYDLRDIYPYTWSHIGLTAYDNNSPAQPNTHNLIGIIGTPAGFPPNATVQSATKAPHPMQTQNGGPYFMNPSITPTNSNDPNFTGRPRAVDQFILISAGPDGIYGTADDITSFGSVSN